MTAWNCRRWTKDEGGIICGYDCLLTVTTRMTRMGWGGIACSAVKQGLAIGTGNGTWEWQMGNGNGME